MDVVWYGRYRRGGGDRPLLEWEFSTKPDWDDVSEPGQVGKRLVEGFLQRDLDPKWAPLTDAVMHWGYGMFWGVQYGIVTGSRPGRSVARGLVLGPIVWASSYVLLPLAKLYKPIWDYDVETLAKDLSAHVCYGLATASAFRLLDRPEGT
jgi:hypothetical protein